MVEKIIIIPKDMMVYGSYGTVYMLRAGAIYTTTTKMGGVIYYNKNPAIGAVEQMLLLQKQSDKFIESLRNLTIEMILE